MEKERIVSNFLPNPKFVIFYYKKGVHQHRTLSFYSIPAKIKNPVTGFILADLNGADNSFKSTIYCSSPVIPDIVPESADPVKSPGFTNVAPASRIPANC